MPTITVQPNRVFIPSGHVRSWEDRPDTPSCTSSGSDTELDPGEIDDGVDSHDGDATYIWSDRSCNISTGGSIVTIDFGTVGGTAPYSRVLIRVVARAVTEDFGPGYPGDPLEGDGDSNTFYSMIINPGVTGATHQQKVCELTGSWQVYELELLADGTAGNITQSNADAAVVTLSVTAPLGNSFNVRVTAVELVFTYASSGGATVSFSDTVNFADSYTVSGSGTAPQTQTFSDTVNFADSYDIVSRSSDDIAEDRTDITCRGCGTFIQIREDLAFYADGRGAPLTWDGVSASATTVGGGAKELAFPVAHRNRVFLFGDEPYRTGTVTTNSGVTLITTSATWPSTTLGKSVSINGAGFGSSGRCSTVVKNLNGTQVTLAEAPNATLLDAQFVVFGGTSGKQLQWSAEGDHTSWPDSVLPVGRFDGELPTGAAAIGRFLLLFCRLKTYRFDYDQDPSDSDQRDLTVIAEFRGLVANKCCVVIEGTAYCMDQFACNNGEAAFWYTRGGALFPLEIGRPISRITAVGQDYEIDWTKSACWFAWYSPASNSICWAVTRQGQPYPDIALEYFRPNTEGSDESGRWVIREYDHYLIQATNAIGKDGVLRAWLVVADKDDSDTLYVCADANAAGDMALEPTTGTVLNQISTTVIELAAHTAFHVGSIIEIEVDGTIQVRTVLADNGVRVTVSAAWDGDVSGLKYRAGYRARARFKTIAISPDPNFGQVHIQQVHAMFDRSSADAELQLTVYSDHDVTNHWILGGAANSSATFPNDQRVVSIGVGARGFQIALEFTLLSPGGDDFVRSVEIVRAKFNDPAMGAAGEP